MTANPLDYGWWLASRASGIVAFGLMSVSVVIGLVLASGLARRRGLPRKLVAIHQQTALQGLIAIGVHGATLLGDNWLKAGVAGITIPFTLDYRPVFTGLGIIAGYLAAALGLSFYARRLIGVKTWRKLHRLTVVAWAFGAIHAIGAGSDASAPWFRAILLTATVPIVFLFAYRVMPSGKPATAKAAQTT
jgi:methionine sulfoxide reductase heme-binding subunit